MISNIIEFFDDNPTEELFVDISRNKKLQINFDIIFPKISCSSKYINYIYFLL